MHLSYLLVLQIPYLVFVDANNLSYQLVLRIMLVKLVRLLELAPIDDRKMSALTYVSKLKHVKESKARN